MQDNNMFFSSVDDYGLLINSAFRICIHSGYGISDEMTHSIYKIVLKHFDEYNIRLYSVFYNDLKWAFESANDPFFKLDKNNDDLNKINELAILKHEYYESKKYSDEITGKKDTGIYLDKLDFGVICYASVVYGLGRRTYIVNFICKTLIEYKDRIYDEYILMIIDIITNAKDYGQSFDKDDWMKALDALNEEAKRRKLN